MTRWASFTALPHAAYCKAQACSRHLLSTAATPPATRSPTPTSVVVVAQAGGPAVVRQLRLELWRHRGHLLLGRQLCLLRLLRLLRQLSLLRLLSLLALACIALPSAGAAAAAVS